MNPSSAATSDISIRGCLLDAFALERGDDLEMRSGWGELSDR
jgi:hypothetical protein